ncbi:MAG: hypothetical protein CMJ96_10490 [Planctomycetes bacterium]|nr:hypothetical protein [Planctomycetota bacterium]
MVHFNARVYVLKRFKAPFLTVNKWSDTFGYDARKSESQNKLNRAKKPLPFSRNILIAYFSRIL